MSRRFKICLAAWIAVVACSAISNHVSAQDLQPIPATGDVPAASDPPTAQTPVAAADWKINIVPAQRASIPVVIDSEADAGCENCNQTNVSDYTRVYNSIPFNRAEYNVNPSYRHDSTMEILTGNSRHLTVLRHSTARPRQVTTAPVARAAAFSANPYNPYAYGYLRPALRLEYYKHFPSLNPYLNIWNLTGAY